MPAYTRQDIRKALRLETAIREALDDVMDGPDPTPSAEARELAGAVSAARIAALQALLKRMPDDEVIDAFY